MKRLFALTIALFLLFGLVTTASAAPPPPDKPDCTKIQDGTLLYSASHYLAGQPLTVGFDAYGYNYQAHMFSGSYANAYLGGYGYPPYTGDDAAYLAANPGAANTWFWPFRDVQLLMKWDQGWTANVDCNDDGKLDRHYGLPSYTGSGAWETNHMWGEYEYGGQSCNWDTFTKIVAVPDDAFLNEGYWYTWDDTEIGPTIWGQFAIIQDIYNDPCGGYHGISYKGDAPTGFGFYSP